MFNAPAISSGAEYQIDNSLIFNVADPSYLSRTFGAGDRKKWTWSGWVKKGIETASSGYLLNAGTSGSDRTIFGFNGNSTKLMFFNAVGAAHKGYLTTDVFLRDPAAWYHLTCAVDLANTSVKIYVNGVESTLTVQQTLVNINGYINNAQSHVICKAAYEADSYHDGYLADVHFIDGQALTPDDFGETDLFTGQWIPKTYEGTYGTNGFILEFKDDTSATTLGYDTSGNDNHFTPSGLVTTDQTIDTPTNSFCVLNTLDGNAVATFSDGNLVASCPTTPAGTNAAIGTYSVSSGKWYWEVTVTSYGAYPVIGIADENFDTTNYAGETTDSWGYGNFGFKYNGSGAEAYAGASYTAGDIIGVALDMDTGDVEFFKNNSSQGVAFTGLTGNIVPAVSCGTTVGTPDIFTCDFGQKGFTYTPPTDFKALSTTNLPAPANNADDMIQNVVATEANIAADLATARTGWADYVDILKNRTSVETWAWQFSHDSSNEYAVSTTATRQAKRTLSGTDQWVGHSIRIGSAYGTAAGSASHTNGAATTITHNLGESRAFILLFPRSNGAVYVYHPDLTSGNLLVLTTTAAQAALTQITNVTGNAFDIGSGHTTDTYDYLVLTEGDTIKLFTYEGNGSADGTMINTGLLSSFVGQKSIDSTSDWHIYDSEREGYNPSNDRLNANTTAAEGTADEIGIYSNGIKNWITTDPNVAETYIGIAIGQPFKYVNAR